MGSVINGTTGNDTLTSTGVGDTLVGGAGNDVYFVDDATDVVSETISDSPKIFFANQFLTGQNSFFPVTPHDGTNVVFAGSVIGGFNSQQIYSRDYLTNVVKLVSSSAAGAASNSFVFPTSSVSADGTKVAFASGGTNLVTGDSNNQIDVFIKDLSTGAIALVSTSSTGVQGQGLSSLPSMSADGSKVAFISSANNLVAGDTLVSRDVFVKDLSTGALTLVSSSSSGQFANGVSYLAALSPDGTKVVFESEATNLVAGVTNNGTYLYMKDLTSGATILVSSHIQDLNHDGLTNTPVFSSDGTKLAFLSSATDLVTGVTDGNQHLYIKNMTTGAVTLASAAGDGTPADNFIISPTFSPDGSKIAFATQADNLLPSDNNAAFDLYIKDLTTGVVTRVTTDSDNSITFYNNSAPQNQEYPKLAFTNDGRVLFVSNMDNPDNDLYIQNLTPVGGVDTVNSSVSYTLSANVENLTLSGSANINATGNALDNVLTGNSGNNTLNGGAGTDVLIGGAGNDLYIVDSPFDSVQEGIGAGTDSVQASFNYYLGANVENLLLTGTTAISGIGNNLANTITGNSGNNTLNGNTGNDTMIGGAGNDLYIVDSTLDVVVEGVGGGTDTIRTTVSYTMGANVENLVLFGNTALNGSGNSIANTITGNIANNIINGGDGNDTLTGGGGNDSFKFATTLNATTNTDLITDFSSGDQLQLSHLVFTQAGGIGTLNGNAFAAGAGFTSGQDADDRIIYNTTNGNLYYDADGSGAGASILFAQLGTFGHPTLTAAMIQVV